MEQTKPVAATEAAPVESPPTPETPLGDDDKEGGELRLLHLDQVKRIIRDLIVGEKNLRLYPVNSKVVRQAVEAFIESTHKFLEDAREPLHLHVSQTSLTYNEEEVYHEDVPAKSMAHRLFKDGIRGLVVHEEVKDEELESLLDCFKETANSEEDEDDFGTVFWEKDCTNIQLQLIDDSEEAKDEEVVSIPTQHVYALGFDPARLALAPEEEERLREELSDRQGVEEGDDAFEIDEEEVEKIRQLSRDEETYFAIHDFVDILIEHMARNKDPKALEDASRLIKEIAQALVENFDFEHASSLLAKVHHDPHPALTEMQRKTIREIVGDFCDAKTVKLLDDFLRDSPKFPKAHPVFQFMKLLGGDAVQHICAFMTHERHIPGLSKVLVELRKNAGRTYEKHMMGSNLHVAQAMIYVILNTEGKAEGLTRIAKALTHQKEDVRKVAAKTILEHGDERVGAFFLPLLEDPPLFNLALQFYAKVSYPDAYKPIETLIRGKGFHQLEQPRQALCFKALILANPEKALKFISWRILKFHRCLTLKARRRKVAALRALAYHKSEGAKEILSRYSNLKKSALAGVASQALKLWEKESQGSDSSRSPVTSEPPGSGSRTEKEVQSV